MKEITKVLGFYIDDPETEITLYISSFSDIVVGEEFVDYYGYSFEDLEEMKENRELIENAFEILSIDNDY